MKTIIFRNNWVSDHKAIKRITILVEFNDKDFPEPIKKVKNQSDIDFMNGYRYKYSNAFLAVYGACKKIFELFFNADIECKSVEELHFKGLKALDIHLVSND